MDETDWDSYGTGNYEKCADCMVHSGFEATAVKDAVRNPLKALMVSLRGVVMARPRPTSPWLDSAQPGSMFSRHVEHKLAEIRETKARTDKAAAAG